MTTLPSSSSPTTRSPRRFGPITLAIGLLLIALNLRIGVASVGPVLARIQDDLGFSETIASLLTTIPVFAFGLVAFVTPILTRRFGLHRLLGAAMAALAIGIVLRLHPSIPSLFAGTLIVGAAIAIANVAMPAAIKHEFAQQVGLMMGLYSTALSVGAALASGLTVPIVEHLTDDRWRPALAFWAIPAILAFVVWLPHTGRSTTPTAPASADADLGLARPRPALRDLFTDPLAIAVTAFMGLQSIGYYVTLTWVPTILQDHGMSEHTAGWMLSYSAFPAILTSLLAPSLAQRIRPTWIPVTLAVALTGIAFLGLGVSPTSGTYLWMTAFGIGGGISISLALSYIVWRSPDAQHTGQLSTMAQGFGYLLAGLGPIGIGALHDLSGGWTLPLIALGILLVPQLIFGAIASRDAHILTPRVAPRPALATERP